MLHWRIPVEQLRPFIPARLILDSLEGSAWVSLVAFTMEQIRPRLLPAIPALSNFHELNLRTYVSYEGKPGVYFLSIEAEKSISAFVARGLSGLPYRKAAMNRNINGTAQDYVSSNDKTDFYLRTTFTTGSALQHKKDADLWLTERYCLYAKTGTDLFRYDIHHEAWPLLEVAVTQLELNYHIGDFNFSAAPPNLIHYSPGVQVLAWSKVKL